MFKFLPLIISLVLASTVYSQESIQIETEEREIPTTTVEFDKEVHDFGEVPYGSKNEVIFTLTNSGEIPLIISSAKSTCGCTVPFFPQQPIMPGESSEIHAVFKPKKGQTNVVKPITISGNFPNKTVTLKIKATVVPLEDYEEEDSFIVQSEQQEKDKDAIEAVSPGCFAIFPNPTSNELQLDLKEYIGLSAVINIHDESGRNTHKETISSISSTTTRLDVSGYTSGIYIINIQVAGKKPMSQCFVVTN